MRLQLSALLLLLLSHVAFGQLPGAASIEGTVVSLETGSPVSHVLVYIVSEDITVVTDADGRFRLRGLPAGVHLLKISRLGYEDFPLKLELDPDQRLVIEEQIALTVDPDVPAVLALWEAGEATGKPATVSGTIVDIATDQGILGAFVGAVGESAVTVTGADGSFALGGLEPGLHTLSVRRIGYHPLWIQLAVDPDQVFEVGNLAIEANPTELDELVVNEDILGVMSNRLRGFIERAQTGFGHFVTERDIERRRPLLVTDMLRGIPGVRVVTRGTDNVVQMIGTRRVQGGCTPLVFVDGMRLSDVDLDDFLHPEILAGIEVYRRPSEIPPRFNVTGSACGVIVVWTRL